VSFTYVAGQMRGVGIVFSRFLEVDINTGVIIGMAIVFFYAVLGGMKGITYTQVAQYCVLIFAYLVPAVFISILITGNPIPQMGFGDQLINEPTYLLTKLDQVMMDLGFRAYTSGVKETIDVFCITAALMLGTAGLPHVIVRFFTVPDVAAARKSAGYALVFIAILYTTAPAVASFARINLFESTHNITYTTAPEWFKNWERIGLIAWKDKNQDGKIQHAAGNAFKPIKPIFSDQIGDFGQREISNEVNLNNNNEVYIDRDIIVLASPEMANLPPWIIALVAAGALAAALSTAAGLLLVISSAVSHDLIKKTFAKNISEKNELALARSSVLVAVVIAGLFGIYPPAFVAQVVAFAFGLAAATLFPAILMGIFSKSMNKEGAIAGMLTGLIFTFSYILFFKFLNPQLNSSEYWLWGISPEGIGFIGMLLNLLVSNLLRLITPKTPIHVKEMIDNIRQP
jgi:cation/acetate symporter